MSRDNKGRFSKNHVTQDEEPTSEDKHTTKKITGFLEKPPSIKMIIVMMVTFWVLSIVSPRLADEFHSRIIQSYCKCQAPNPIEMDKRTAPFNHTDHFKFDNEVWLRSIKP
jgi:hypothetical protein